MSSLVSPRKPLAAIGFVVLQVIVGAALGLVSPLIYLFCAFMIWQAGWRPDPWQCSSVHVKSMVVSNVSFDIDAEPCVSGRFSARTVTTVRASLQGETIKVFEYAAPERDSAPIEIEAVDARTIRIALSHAYEASHPWTADMRYVRLSNWRNLTFVY